MSSSDKPVLKVAPCSHEASKFAVENWHYSERMPIGKLMKLGAWENDRFIGVVLFGRGASPNLGNAYGLKQDECAELVRVALTDHASPVTKIVSLALKALKKKSPKLRLIISFADPSQGHVGVIYQGGNWTYAGISNKVIEYFIGGRWVHTREALGGAFGGQALKKATAQNSPRRTVLGKHRYLYALDEEMKRRIEPLRKPYPKRAGSSSVEHPTSGGEAGGSTPTPALNNLVPTP